MSKKLEEELKERLHTRKLKNVDTSVSGSGISSGYCYIIDNDKSVFVKTNNRLNAASMFDGEHESLKHIIATRTIRVPKPLFVIYNYDDTQTSAIAMEYLNIRHLKDESAIKLGQSLANLHDYNNKVLRYNKRASKWIGGKPPSSKAKIEKVRNEDENSDESENEEEENQFVKHSMRIKGGGVNHATESTAKSAVQYPDRFMPEPNTKEITQFGFNVSTACGFIPQINEWTDDWVSFYARHRLDKAIRSLLSDHSDRELSQQWSHLQLKVDKFFSDFKSSGGSDDDKIVPALLHGDLWSGNTAQLNEELEAVVYDPSSFYGHSEYDFGIARMFGGIPKVFETSYFEMMPKKKLFEKRNKLYQLFHHLNHWEHFGSGYRASSLSLIKELNTLV